MKGRGRKPTQRGAYSGQLPEGLERRLGNEVQRGGSGTKEIDREESLEIVSSVSSNVVTSTAPPAVPPKPNLSNVISLEGGDSGPSQGVAVDRGEGTKGRNHNTYIVAFPSSTLLPGE
jgi:hypothetical protein